MIEADNISTDNAFPTPTEFVDEVWQANEQAAERCGTIDRDFCIGGRIIRLRFAGTELIAPVTSALAHLTHLSSSVVHPELTIHIWDTRSSNIKMPFIPLWNDCSERGQVRAFTHSSISVTRLTAAGVFSVWDPARQLAIYWAYSADEIPSYERGAPFRGLLQAWWRAQSGLMLHAGAIGSKQGAALLVGKGGVGKSTAALACMEAGMHYLSDDYCLLTHQPQPEVHSVYCSAKIYAADLQRFPSLPPLISNPQELGEEKALCFLRHGSNCHLMPSLPLRVILLPRISSCPHTSLLPASPMTALQALAPSALLQLPEAGGTELSSIREVVTRVPCFWLESGSDVQRIPQQVMEAIAHD